MSDYALYYWPLPFRGQFVRAVLAHAGKTWDEFDDGDVGTMMGAEPSAQPVPFMGPPMLVEHATGVALAEMTAIVYYLGETLDLMPEGIAARALALKVVCDANDVIDEMTLDGGKQMWTPKRWKAFVPRLERWMTIFETLGTRHGLAADAGFMLGGKSPCIADLVTATLWGTMGPKFPSIAARLAAKAPATAGLTARLMATAELANLAKVSQRQFGDAYCGGEIETSLRGVVE